MDKHDVIMLVFSALYVILIYLLIRITWAIGVWPV